MLPVCRPKNGRLVLTALAGLFLLATPVSAEAAGGPTAEAASADLMLTLKKKKKNKKKKKKKGKKNGKKQSVKKLNIKATGIKTLDDFFGQAAKIDKKLDKAQRERRTGRTAIAAAVGLEKKATLPAAITELKAKAKGKVKLSMIQGVPQLKPKDAMPSDVNAGIEAVNTALASYAQAVKSLAGTPKAAAALVSKAQQMPAKLKEEFSNFNPLQLPAQIRGLKALRNNLRVTSSLPKRTVTVVKGINTDIKMIVETFGGTWPPRL